jgi:hypothetical protein
MVIMAIPQLEAVHDEVVALGGGATGAAGAAGAAAAGVAADIDDIDDPPQTLKAASSNVPAAAGNQWRRIVVIGLFARCMEVLPVNYSLWW